MGNIETSIIIVNYNTKAITLDAINSIVKSKTRTPYEIIVVDNASSDGSVEELKKLKNIVFIANKDNLGFAKGCNIGIKKAKGEYILLLNSDAKVFDDTIDKLVDYAKNNQNVGAVSPKLLNADGSLQKSVFNTPTIIGAFKEFWLKKEGSYQKYAPKGENPVNVGAIVMTAFLITPEAIKKVGLLSEKYFMYFEDLDYCNRLHKNNLDVIYLPSAKVFHLHGASGKSLAEQKNQWRRLIPSSKIYFGLLKHYIITMIIWSGQKWQKITAQFNK